MEAGKLRNRAAIRRPEETLDAYGDTTQSFSTVAEAWVAVEVLSGRELVEAQQVVAQADYRVVTRCPGVEIKVNDELWLSCKDITLQILHINDVELRGREFILLCKRNIDV